MPDMFPAFMAQIRRVPKGKVATYGDIAYAAGFPGAARQVSWALHSSKGLPWHRIIGSNGKILCTGELGFEQRMRLQAEGVSFIGLRVDLKKFRFNFFEKKATPNSNRNRRQQSARPTSKSRGKY